RGDGDDSAGAAEPGAGGAVRLAGAGDAGGEGGGADPVAAEGDSDAIGAGAGVRGEGAGGAGVFFPCSWTCCFGRVCSGDACVALWAARRGDAGVAATGG